MPKVFIIEPPRNNIDVSDAQKFGEIVYIFEVDDRRCSVFHHVHFGQMILQRLESLKFDSELDSVCVVGAMLTVSIALIAISQYYDEFNVLLFNSVDDSYVQKRFNKSNWKGLNDGAKNRTVIRSNQRIR